MIINARGVVKDFRTGDYGNQNMRMKTDEIIEILQGIVADYKRLRKKKQIAVINFVIKMLLKGK